MAAAVNWSNFAEKSKMHEKPENHADDAQCYKWPRKHRRIDARKHCSAIAKKYAAVPPPPPLSYCPHNRPNTVSIIMSIILVTPPFPPSPPYTSAFVGNCWELDLWT
jgi:hypothetical protein